MEHVDKEDLQQMEKIYRRNLVHSCTGYKSANLVGSISNKETCDLAIFNSIFHVGSNPPMLGCILRPGTAPKSTYHNILTTGYFTVNHIQQDMVEQAHRTSSVESPERSGFEKAGLEKQYLDGFPAPYVERSNIKLGCKFLNEYHIKENDTKMLIAAVEHIYYDPGIQVPDGWLRLDDAETVVFNGLDAYALPALIDRFHYAEPGQELKSFFREST